MTIFQSEFLRASKGFLGKGERDGDAWTMNGCFGFEIPYMLLVCMVRVGATLGCDMGEGRMSAVVWSEVGVDPCWSDESK